MEKYKTMWEELKSKIKSDLNCHKIGYMQSLSESTIGEQKCKEILKYMQGIEEKYFNKKKGDYMTGRHIFFTQKEMQVIRDVCSKWCDIMRNSDEESRKCVKESLDDGLGSALRKLYKGLDDEQIYKDYKTIR